MDRPSPPTPGPSTRPRRLPALALLATALGCAQAGPLTERRTTLGTLKANVGRLEQEKVDLKHQVADLEAERRRLEDRLVQEKDLNDDLATRLDDARNLLSRGGAEVGSLHASAAPEPGPEPDPRPNPRRTTPAGRVPSRGRKSPFAQIPNEIRPLPEPESSQGPPVDPFAPEPGRRYDDLGPQSRRDEPPLWLPVARGDRSRTR